MTHYELDLNGITDRDELYDYLEDELPLPEHFGRNLDAFYDVLTEFGEDWDLNFTDCADPDDSMPDYMRKFRRICRNRA